MEESARIKFVEDCHNIMKTKMNGQWTGIPVFVNMRLVESKHGNGES